MVVPIIKILFFIYLLSISWRAYADPTFWSLINNVNLIFHEAGHALTIFFGEFINIAGGTLFEFGIPLLITLYFVAQRQWYGAMLAAWWLSTAFYSISIYAGDALHRQLPLLGGESVNHDWNTMLNMINMLQYYQEIAGLFFGLSLAALGLATYLIWIDLKPIFQSFSKNRI